MKTVKEVSRISKVSVRTLHYYDSIGLLKPAHVTQAGYRLYDISSIQRLQTILLFRELRFSLKEIKKILDSPNFDAKSAISQQIKLLELEAKRLDSLLQYARKIESEGVWDMNFNAFDKSKRDEYKQEVKKRWGNTTVYKEYEAKEKAGVDFDDTTEGLMQIFTELGKLKNCEPTDNAVFSQISALKAYISKNYYSCTNKILRGLGEMYTADSRFKENIDKAGGTGTAEFVRLAIFAFCDQSKE